MRASNRNERGSSFSLRQDRGFAGFRRGALALCLSIMGLLASTPLCPLQAAQSPWHLTVDVVDRQGQPLHCRAWVEVGGERLFRPSAPASCTPYPRDRSFSCDGNFTIDIPGDRALIHVERGKEYRPVNR